MIQMKANIQKKILRSQVEMYDLKGATDTEQNLLKQQKNIKLGE